MPTDRCRLSAVSSAGDVMGDTTKERPQVSRGLDIYATVVVSL